MGEQTWNSCVGCLPLVCEFWFAWICNSLIFPFFGSSCLWASGKLILGFLRKAPLGSECCQDGPHKPLCQVGQIRTPPAPCCQERASPGVPRLFRENCLLPLTTCLAFSGVFLFFSLCSSTHWITEERMLNLHFQRDIYIQLWNKPELHVGKDDLSEFLLSQF